MSQILNKVRDVDSNNSDAVKDVLSTFFLNLTKHIDADSNRWLRALEDIINRFPRFCGSHRNTIETYLINFIDSNNYYNVIEAAKCAHALQQVRPPHEKSATAKTCWREHLVILCNAAHKLLGSLFPNAIDIYKGNSASNSQVELLASSPLSSAFTQILSMPKTQNNNVKRQSLLETRLRNILVFIQAALVEIYPVAKPIQPQLIIEVIVRALSLSSGGTQVQDVAKAVTVKIQALRTLDALVACLGSNLIPYSSLIFKFVLLTLKWCTDLQKEETSPVRRAAYDSLRSWLVVVRSWRAADATRGRGWEDELVHHVLADITPHRHVVQLTMRPQSTKNLSKRAKRKQTNSMLQESSIGAHANDNVPLPQESNDEVAISALEFAETFFHVCGTFLKPNSIKLLSERLTRECYAIVSGAYSTPRSLALLRALEALRVSAPPPAPTHHCLRLYADLATTALSEVARFCSQALLNIRLHLHCSPPSLNFAIEPPKQPAKEPAPLRMSSKNRAALEALLGAEKISGDRAEDIIDLADEPARKKARQDHDEDDTDRISIGSSIEISDESDEVIEAVNTIEDENQEKDQNAEQDPVELDDDDDDDVDIVDARRKSVDNEDVAEANCANEGQEATKDTTEEERNGNGELHENEYTAESSAGDKNKEATSTFNSIGIDKSASQDTQSDNIHEARTQIPSNTNGEQAEEACRGRSMDVDGEVTYDFPNTGSKKVSIMEKTDDENLPSTNETDDIPITCGQVVKNSQELEIEKGKEVENKENEEPRLNGDCVTDKTGAVNKDLSVEDMLADFVDEVVEEGKA